MNLSDELIKKLKTDPSFAILQRYILSKINELNSLDGLEKMSNDRAGEEARARMKAANKLTEILSPFIDLTEKHETSDKEIQTAKEKVAL